MTSLLCITWSGKFLNPHIHIANGYGMWVAGTLRSNQSNELIEENLVDCFNIN